MELENSGLVRDSHDLKPILQQTSSILSVMIINTVDGMTIVRESIASFLTYVESEYGIVIQN